MQTLTSKQTKALSNLSQTYGELIGTLQGLSYRLPATERKEIEVQVGNILELDPIGELLAAIFEEED
jgi:hypothetical protein